MVSTVAPGENPAPAFSVFCSLDSCGTGITRLCYPHRSSPKGKHPQPSDFLQLLQSGLVHLRSTLRYLYLLTFRIKVCFLPDNLGGSLHLKSLFPNEVVFPGLRVRTWCLLGAITCILQCSAVVNYNPQVINKLIFFNYLPNMFLFIQLIEKF